MCCAAADTKLIIAMRSNYQARYLFSYIKMLPAARQSLLSAICYAIWHHVWSLLLYDQLLCLCPGIPQFYVKSESAGRYIHIPDFVDIGRYIFFRKSFLISWTSFSFWVKGRTALKRPMVKNAKIHRYISLSPNKSRVQETLNFM